MRPTVVPWVSGLTSSTTVESWRTTFSGWSLSAPATDAATMPAISAISSTRPHRELSCPEGNRTLTSPWTATGSICVPDNPKTRAASGGTDPRLAARYDTESTAAPAAHSAAAPASSQPNGRSGRRMTRNAPAIAYGTA
jgi:hypothetical protein